MSGIDNITLLETEFSSTDPVKSDEVHISENVGSVAVSAGDLISVSNAQDALSAGAGYVLSFELA